MPHDVFISYAVEDAQVAEKVCRALEEDGIKCWIAPRDVPYGADYEEAIVDAISTSSLLVLVLSAHSNASQHVKREIQNACAEGAPTQIIPLRIDAVAYSKALRYYLGSAQWLDASTPPLEAHLRRLVEHAHARLGRPSESVPAQTAAASTVRRFADSTEASPVEPLLVSAPTPFPISRLALGAGAVLLLVVAAAGAYWLSVGGPSNKNSNNANSNNPANYNGDVAPPPTPTPPLMLLAATPTPQQQRPTPREERSEREILRDVYGAVNQVAIHHGFSRTDVNVEYRVGPRGSVILLTGAVPSEGARNALSTAVGRVHGLNGVANRVAVLPVMIPAIPPPTP